MAIGDKQVLNPQVADGSSDYLIPGAVSLQLKAVQALFEDNGALTDWLPAVVAISDSGHTFWRALDQGVKVTAGADAEVSWFPNVKHAAASTSTGTASQWAYLQGGSLLSDNSTLATFTSFGQDASGVFTLDAAHQVITIGTTGVFRHHYYCQWESDNVPSPAAADIFRILPIYSPSGSILQQQITNFEATRGSHLPDTGNHYFWDAWGLDIVNVKTAGMTISYRGRSRSAGVFDGLPAVFLERFNAAVADVSPNV